MLKIWGLCRRSWHLCEFLKVLPGKGWGHIRYSCNPARQSLLEAVIISLALCYEEKEQVSEFSRGSLSFQSKNEKLLSRDSFKSVKPIVVQCNIDSVHPILTNFPRNYGEIILPLSSYSLVAMVPWVPSIVKELSPSLFQSMKYLCVKRRDANVQWFHIHHNGS